MANLIFYFMDPFVLPSISSPQEERPSKQRFVLNPINNEERLHGFLTEMQECYPAPETPSGKS
jgi:hypothetical protein